MNGSTQTSWRSRVLFAGIAGALAIGAVAALPSSAQAFWVGFPFPGYYPGSYYGYYPPPPYYYAPPAYYPPAAYPADPGYAAPAQPAPSAYTSPSTSATPNAAAQITYTNKPAFKNAAGQTCREYTTADASGRVAYGTACQAADGQWRVAN
ncbi:MAG TPA: hypothetical protein VN808_16845 [Stellaceae bacterium]|nr:hypothetical protein [Stellaceae bacterium]